MVWKGQVWGKPHTVCCLHAMPPACPQGAFDAFAMGNYPYPSSYISEWQLVIVKG